MQIITTHPTIQKKIEKMKEKVSKTRLQSPSALPGGDKPRNSDVTADRHTL